MSPSPDAGATLALAPAETAVAVERSSRAAASVPPALPEADPKAAARQAMLAGPILPTMLKLALPTVVVLVAQTFVGVAETFYVGFLGTDALVGVALVFPIAMLMAMMSNGGIGGGVAAAVARAVGAGRQHDADALVWHTLVLAVVLGLAFTAAILLAGPALYRALGGHGAALDAALLYSAFVFAGAVPAWIVNLLCAALRGAGNVRVPALVVLLGALALVPLSPALIFGLGPLPGLGVAGAGLAVTAYYTVAAVVLLGYMRGGRSGLTLRRSRLEARLFGDILGVGVISALSAVQINLTVILVTGAVGRFGIEALAGYGLASRLDYLLIPLLFGLGTAVLTMVGTNIGAGNVVRASRIAWLGTLVAVGFTEAVGLAVAVFPNVWLGLFSTDPAVLEPGALYLRLVGPFYGAIGATFLLSFASQGGGRPLWPFLGGTVRLVIAAGVGWYAVAHHGAGLATLFLIIAAAAVGAAAICVAAALAGATWRQAAAH
ncbi:MATE family efflux transporter [Chelatococcus reniformis]|uniref:MATE family efflux transporter n=1 Tax=Chelatococcus reniformis TaxID=1494448 RepID=A0A916UFW4_9HYPH|nr:MATE family efflux transporter [Chelatococcus reniformis]GGC71318.1 MATE family efflux transporter [Chelatococcus reniformis]